MTIDPSNVVVIARREYVARGRTRTFKATTVLLVIVGLVVALAPVILQYFDKGSTGTTIEVSVGDSKPTVDVAAALNALLNVSPTAATTGGSGGTGTGAGSGAAGSQAPQYRVVTTTDIAGARLRVADGKSGGLLIVTRNAAGELEFAYATKASAIDRTSLLVRQAAGTIAVQDRLTSAGIPPIDQAKLFAGPTYTVQAPDGSAPTGPSSPDGFVNQFAGGFVLAIVLFMAIILYGQWVAYSVVEEKSSRVMEVILGAATPFELLGGKVIGVGALAVTQYVIVGIPATVALLLQPQIAALVLGGTAGSIALPAGISISLLLAFGVFFVLGFALYAALYAGAAALVSRTEDINQIVAPLTLVAAAGYLVAVYSSTGLLDPNSKLVVIMSYVPFFSPYLMLSRMGAGLVGPLEVAVAIAILAVSVPLAIWVAARFYSAGVLMYGQRPSLRLMVRVLRGRA
jgi:ABC-2 type transport system permease protein